MPGRAKQYVQMLRLHVYTILQRLAPLLLAERENRAVREQDSVVESVPRNEIHAPAVRKALREEQGKNACSAKFLVKLHRKTRIRDQHTAVTAVILCRMRLAHAQLPRALVERYFEVGTQVGHPLQQVLRAHKFIQPPIKNDNNGALPYIQDFHSVNVSRNAVVQVDCAVFPTDAGGAEMVTVEMQNHDELIQGIPIHLQVNASETNSWRHTRKRQPYDQSKCHRSMTHLQALRPLPNFRVVIFRNSHQPSLLVQNVHQIRVEMCVHNEGCAAALVVVDPIDYCIQELQA